MPELPAASPLCVPPTAVRTGPWTLRTHGVGTRARSWVTVSCTLCQAVPWDEPLGMTAAFASIDQARHELPGDWGWLVTAPPGGPEQVLCPGCAARLAADSTAASHAARTPDG